MTAKSIDAKTAFLQGDMRRLPHKFRRVNLPTGRWHGRKDRRTYLRSIYDLKQAARCWNTFTDTFLRSNSYKKSCSDPLKYAKSVKYIWKDEFLESSKSTTEAEYTALRMINQEIVRLRLIYLKTIKVLFNWRVVPIYMTAQNIDISDHFRREQVLYIVP